MAEIIVRFVFEVILAGLLGLLGWIGRAVSRVVIPPLTAGRIQVVPAPANRRVIERWHGLHHLTNGAPIMGERLAAIVGLLILFAGLVILALAARMLR
jgi:hypothetical protein